MQYDASMLCIGRQKQLLIDDLVIESAENICRTWHTPEKVAENPVLSKSEAWEDVTYMGCNSYQVLRDPKDQLFKCLYANNKNVIEKRCVLKSVFNAMYAESEDGVNWRKPILGLHKIDGQDTNVVIPNAYDFGLVLDPHEQDENKRFKMIHTMFIPGGDVDSVVAQTSGDLIHWTRMEDPVLGRHGARLDDVIIMHYDPLSRMYIMNTRHYNMYAVARNLNNPSVGQFTLPYYPLDWRRMNKRRVWQSESADFIHWGEPYAVLTPEAGLDDLDECFYGLCQYHVGDLTLGFLNTFNYTPDTTSLRLVYSRNGKNWTHLNKRQQFIPNGGKGQWDEFMITLTGKPISVDDELLFFYGGSCNHHDWWQVGKSEGLDVPEAHDQSLVDYSVGIAKLRQDGFASLDAGAVRRGILITRPFISDGSELLINARCRNGGSIAAEVVDVYDKVLPGFSRQECDVFTGDSVSHTVTWKHNSRIPTASSGRASYPQPETERFRKIRFFMENAELYSFTLA